ncbi:FtsK/SpoIIIE domain-containing protein [Streptomyces sp. Caat 7-52]|uniref:FtsK/SpoIIIE domain-containing protein n=1 Tax=Streptomyces sp. Caat 7-52 TaxID=2949637 RepID=UPI0020365A43|nr:FtsK/SpoIIIE domain-containing protein [Streptomyces sp. Caat 7-52]
MSLPSRSAPRTRYAYGPPPGADPADGLLAHVDPAGARLLAPALRPITDNPYLLPRLGAVWLWGDEIVARLADAPPDLLPDHWRAGPDGGPWFLGRQAAQSYVTPDGTAGSPGHLPLVTVGRNDDLRLLLHLDAGTGLGAVTGPGEHRQALLASIAAELATAPWSNEIRISCVGVPPEVAAAFPDRVKTLPGIPELIESVTERAAAGVRGDEVLTGWAPRRTRPATAGRVLLVGIEPSPAEARDLARLAARGGRTGPRVLVGTAADDLPGAGYEIRVAPDGRVTAPLLGADTAPESAPPARTVGRTPPQAQPDPRARPARPPSWSALLPAPRAPGHPAPATARWTFTVVTPAGPELDVVVEADPATPVRTLAEQLGRRARHPAVPDLFTAEGELLAPDTSLARTLLYDGCRIFLGAPPRSTRPDADTPLRLTAEDFARFRKRYVTAGQGGALSFDRRAAAETVESRPAPESPDGPGPPRGGALRRAYATLRDSLPRDRRDEPRPRYPDAFELPAEIFGSPTRLWERAPGHADGLVLRVGRSPSGPRVLALWAGGSVDIVAERDVARRLAGWLVAQTVLLHPPSDVAVRVLTDETGKAFWSFARWLPPDGLMARGARPVRISRDPAGHARHLDEAALIIHERLREQGPGTFWGRTALVLVLDDPSALRAAPWAEEVLRSGPEVDVYVIRLAEKAQPLDDWDGTTLLTDRTGLRIIDPAHGDPGEGGRCIPDQLVPAQLDALARLLAPLRDDPAPAAGHLAGRLPDLLDLDLPTARQTAGRIAERWQGTPRSPAAVLGGSAGRPVVLDLRDDGPHALVAGAAGSGMEELLCGWLTSLAVANRPDELNLLFVHHDGGEALAPAARLPHTVGVHTALDPYTAARGLTALAAELGRRQKLVKEAGARDFEQYTVIRASDAADLPALPRLVLVVTDLAQLSEETPEFVSGLVEATRRGAKLGVHLVCATRRPSDAVTPDLLAHAPLRIVLRLPDPADSELLIGTPAAARLESGRHGLAYVRRASGTLELVRRARLDGPEPETSVPRAGVRLRVTDWTGAPRQRAARTPVAAHGGPVTALVGAVAQAAAALDDLPAPHVPWPPPLPLSVRLKETATGPDALWAARPRPGTRTPVVFGLRDAPDAQGFEQAVWDLGQDGPLFVSGDTGSGRTQLLLTLAVAVAEQYSVEDVHLYAVDCGSGALGALTDLVHCGAVVTRDEPERMRRLIDKLVTTVRSRQELFTQTGSRSLHGHRQERRGERPPYLVLLLDGWEEFTLWARRTGNEACVRDLLGLLQDTRAGLCAAVTGGRGVLQLRSGVADAALLVLRQADRAGYEGAGLGGRPLPPVIGPGRGLDPATGTEVQIALHDRIQETVTETRRRDAHVSLARKPFGIGSSALAADRFSLGPAGRPVGREDVFAWLDRNYRDGTSAALLGPRRAGKSWIVKELQERMHSDGLGNVQQVVTLSNRDRAGSQDELAVRLMPVLAGATRPADTLMDRAATGRGASRLVLLLDEVGRLTGYDPAAVSWLRDLGQAGAWLVYCGTYKDWNETLRHALRVPGSSFGNDVNHFTLGPLAESDAREFLTGTAQNEGLVIPPVTADRILKSVGPWPFYLQVIGDALVRTARAGSTPALGDAGALRSLIERELLVKKADVFRSRWSEIGPAARAALLDAGGGPPRNPTPAQSMQLRDVGLLLPQNKWLSDPPFFDWIQYAQQELHDEEQHR